MGNEKCQTLTYPEFRFVDPLISVLIQHREGDLEPGLRLDQDGEEEEVFAVGDNAVAAQTPEELVVVLGEAGHFVHHVLNVRSFQTEGDENRSSKKTFVSLTMTLFHSRSSLEPWTRLPLHHGLEEVLGRHVDLAVVLHRRELEESLLTWRQLPLFVLGFAIRRKGDHSSLERVASINVEGNRSLRTKLQGQKEL